MPTEIEIEDINISSGHIVHTTNSKCSRMHGHNWRISIRLLGNPAENGMVLDFIDIKKLIKKMDHRVIIPMHLLNEDEGGWNYTFEVHDKVYSLPKADCYVIMEQVASAELIALHIYNLVRKLAMDQDAELIWVNVEIYETDHGVARYSGERIVKEVIN